MTRPLRPHQIEGIESIRSSLARGSRRLMLAMPTGAGKTLLSAAIVESARAKSKRVLFCVPALSLVDQTVEAFWREGIRDVGVIQGVHELTNWSRPVQIASVQTLARRSLPEADLVIIDEAHRWFKFYETWLANPDWRSVPFIGLSATPWTRGLGRWFDDLIVPVTTQQLIDQGYLAPFRVFAPCHPDLSGVRTVAGDFHEGDLAHAMNTAPLVADIVTTWKQRGEDRPTLCFAVDRAHAKRLQKEFEASGVPTDYVDCHTDAADREKVRRRFHAGDVKIVVNVGVLTTGVDWDVRCLILARPTRSEMLFVQIVGRGLRTAPGKADCLILDHSDNHSRLGFVTDIHHDKLDDGAGVRRDRKAPEALPKECPSCNYLRPPKVSTCPACGFKPEVRSEIECADGELIELRAKPARGVTTAEEQFWFGALRVHARRRGYADGWASHKFREKFGIWPNLYGSAPDVEPTREILNWILSRQIAFAKSRRSA